uniref:F-box domain-containing protein n=1 Tax=Strongyloides papillosus TaxID=174720 RepID=A0A0N5B6D2_STREA
METLSLQNISESTENCVKIDFITSLPLEISKYILCYLSRPLIDNCRLVSKNWNNLIKSNSKSLPKRQYKKVRISSDSVFQIYVKERNMKSRQWTFEEKITTNDMNKNTRKRKHVWEEDVPNKYIANNDVELKTTSSSSNSTNTNEILNNNFIYKMEKHSNVYQDYFSHFINHSPYKTKKKKNKVPCDTFFDTLKKISQNSFVETLELEEISLNDEIVDRIIDALKKVTIGTLSISFVKLKYCTPSKFLSLFDRLNLNVTRGYRVNWARMATNGHFSITNIIHKLQLNERKINKHGTLEELDIGLLTDLNNDTIITKFDIKEVKMLLKGFLFLRIDGSNINFDILKEIIMEWNLGNKLPKTICLSNCPLTTDLNTLFKTIEFSKELGASIRKNGEVITLRSKNGSMLTLKIVEHSNFGDQLQIDTH